MTFLVFLLLCCLTLRDDFPAALAVTFQHTAHRECDDPEEGGLPLDPADAPDPSEDNDSDLDKYELGETPFAEPLGLHSAPAGRSNLDHEPTDAVPTGSSLATQKKLLI